jgi:hypothetical protein
MEILHEVLRNYGRCVAHGHKHIYQSMPRMLTIWFEYGNYCAANPAPSGNKASQRHIWDRMCCGNALSYKKGLHLLVNDKLPQDPDASFLSCLY